MHRQCHVPLVTERCAESLLLIGAPHPQDECNGWYAPTSERVRGHTVYRKRDPGQEVRYLYWGRGRWVCDGDQDPALFYGFVPSAGEHAARSTTAQWSDAEGRWTVTPSEIRCGGMSIVGVDVLCPEPLKYLCRTHHRPRTSDAVAGALVHLRTRQSVMRKGPQDYRGPVLRFNAVAKHPQRGGDDAALETKEGSADTGARNGDCHRAFFWPV